MKTLEATAKETLELAGFDPSILVILAPILIELFKMLIEKCNKTPAEMQEAAKQRGLLNKLIVKKKLKTLMKKHNAEKYYKDDLVDTAFNCCAGKQVKVYKQAYVECGSC